MDRAPLQRLVAGLVAATIVTQWIALTGSASSLGVSALVDPFFASSLAGAAVIGVVALPPRWRALVVILGGLVELALILAFPLPSDPASWIVQRGGGFGLVALAALAWRRDLDTLLCALVLPLFVAASGVALDVTAVLHPRTLDGPLLLADAWLGQPSFVVGRLFGRLPPLGQACAVIYGELPLFCALVLVLDPRRRVEILRAFVAVGVAGYLLYQLFPVAGPRYAFATWPGRVPALEESLRHAALAPPVPRNCMPSLHTAWVLLCATFARRALRPVAGLWVAGTLLATLGLGLHYAVDLIAAVPFLMAMLWGMRQLPPSEKPVEWPEWRPAALAASALGGAMAAQAGGFTLDAAPGLLLCALSSLRWNRFTPVELAASGLGALAAATLLPGLGARNTAVLLALPALAAVVRAPRPTNAASARGVMVAGFAVGGLAAGGVHLFRFAGDDALTAPLLAGALLLGFAAGAALTRPRPIWAALGGLGFFAWSLWRAPEYLLGFEGYPLPKSELVRLGVALWGGAPLAFALGRAVPRPQRRELAAAAAGALLVGLLLGATRP